MVNRERETERGRVLDLLEGSEGSRKKLGEGRRRKGAGK